MTAVDREELVRWREYAEARLLGWRRNDPDKIPKELRCIRALLARERELEQRVAQLEAENSDMRELLRISIQFAGGGSASTSHTSKDNPHG